VIFAGQRLILNVDASNKSSRTVDMISLSIDSYITYKTEKSDETITRKENLVAARVPVSTIKPGQSLNKDCAIDIPPHAAASLRRGTFIQRHYEFTCEAEVLMGTNLTLKAPLLVLRSSCILFLLLFDRSLTLLRRMESFT
jgi:hypothetical protein